MEMVSENIINSPQISKKLYFWERVSVGGLVVFFGLAGIAFILVQVFKWGEEKQVSLLSDSIQALISLASVFLAWRVTTHPAIEGQMRKAWQRVFFAYSAYSIGHCLWFVYVAILEVEPFPSWVDVGFLGFYPLMLWALLTFPTVKKEHSDRLKVSLDIAIVMFGGSIAIWHFIVRPTLESSIPDARLTTVLNLAYILGDLVLIFGISKIILSRPIERVRHTLMILIFGLFNVFVADVGFAYLTLQKTIYSGYWRNLFVTGMFTSDDCFVLSISATLQTNGKRRNQKRNKSRGYKLVAIFGHYDRIWHLAD